MDDPDPSNIMGRKSRNWNINVDVNVGHVVLGLAVIFVAWKVSGYLDDGSSVGRGGTNNEDVELAVETPGHGIAGGGPDR